MLLIGVSIVLIIQVVGIILVIALLSIPPLIALRLTRSFQGLLAVSVTTGVAMTLLGLAGSYRYDLPSGPAIILFGTGLLAASRLLPDRSAAAPSGATPAVQDAPVTNTGSAPEER
jgi:zinc transport system permease protein